MGSFFRSRTKSSLKTFNESSIPPKRIICWPKLSKIALEFPRPTDGPPVEMNCVHASVFVVSLATLVYALFPELFQAATR